MTTYLQAILLKTGVQNVDWVQGQRVTILKACNSLT